MDINQVMTFSNTDKEQLDREINDFIGTDLSEGETVADIKFFVTESNTYHVMVLIEYNSPYGKNL